MSKHTINEIFKNVETKHSLGLFDKKLISSINLFDKYEEITSSEMLLAAEKKAKYGKR